MIYGLEAKRVPENEIPTEAIAVIKCMNSNGEFSLYIRHTEETSTWESLGMLRCAVASLEDTIKDSFRNTEDD